MLPYYQVISNERNGKSGRGIVIQDINASIPICMEKIRDLKNYNKMVPHVKSVDIYETMNFLNVSSTHFMHKFEFNSLR